MLEVMEWAGLPIVAAAFLLLVELTFRKGEDDNRKNLKWHEQDWYYNADRKFRKIVFCSLVVVCAAINVVYKAGQIYSIWS